MKGRASEDGESSFCKIILQGQPTHSLLIPPQFVKRISKEALQGVTLKGPFGSHQQVKVFKDGKDMYLGHGWEQFARDNSLGNNEFLVFNYNGATRFNVQIFDPNRCERINVSRDGQELGTPKHKEMNSKKQKKKSERAMIKEEEDLDPAPIKKKKDRAKRRDWPLAVPVPFTSDLPHFWVRMGVYQVERMFMLPIPTLFSEAYLSKDKTEITLLNQQGESWKVTSNNRNLWRGWSAFARDNKLKTGDVCVFELVACNIMQVHVFPSH